MGKVEVKCFRARLITLINTLVIPISLKKPHQMIVKTKERNLILVLLDIVLKIKITVAGNTV